MNLVSKKIKEIRRLHNLSQERFGKKIGVSGKAVSGYETGKISPPLHVLETISEVYDVAILHIKDSTKEDLKAKLQHLRESIEEIDKFLIS